MYNMYVYINIHISIYYQQQKLYRHIWWHKTFSDSKTIKNISNIKKFNKGKCQPCAFNKNTFVIRHNVTCNSSCETYLMECCICEKSHYVGKSKYSLNLRISTYINSVWRTDGLPCDIHFQMPGYNFNAHSKFNNTEQVNNKSLSKSKIRSLLE